MFLFRPACIVEVALNAELPGGGQRPTLEVRPDGARDGARDGAQDAEKVPIYWADEPVAGTARLTVDAGKTVEHNGLRMELIGRIELYYDRANHTQFLCLEQQAAPAGVLEAGEHQFRFEFEPAASKQGGEKPLESYAGLNCRVRYFVRFTMLRALLPDVTSEAEMWVHCHQSAPEINATIKMEVGIEEALHIEFEFSKSKYHLRDVIVGKVFFLLVRIAIKHMELALVKRESTGSGANIYNETETIGKFEIMDGEPVKGECVPVRMFLGAFELSPTCRSVDGHFSLKYFLNLVLIDEEDRRYFKQQEIILWRKPQKARKTDKQRKPKDTVDAVRPHQFI